jgi:hypothetical protein
MGLSLSQDRAKTIQTIPKMDSDKSESQLARSAVDRSESQLARSAVDKSESIKTHHGLPIAVARANLLGKAGVVQW